MPYALGRKRWAIADGFLPAVRGGAGPRPAGGETVCLLNLGDGDAHVTLTIYYTDRDPAGPYRVTAPARRTLHLRFDDLIDPVALYLDRPYAAVIEASAPVVVQFTRQDTGAAARALAGTLAYSDDDPDNE